MNIFVLDYNMQKSAEYTVDKHVVKMVLEQTQILSSCYHIHNLGHLAPYKKTHVFHPCVTWAAESISNWEWLKEYTLFLAKEYTYRYEKIHKCEGIVKGMVVNPVWKDLGLTPFALAMPDIYKHACAVESYREYYNGDKRDLFNWKNRNVPEWIN